MKANTKYDKEIVNRFHNTKYYECNEFDTKNREFLERESSRLYTQKKSKVTNKLIEKRQYTEEGVFRVLLNIYQKNRTIAFNREFFKEKEYYRDNSNLISIVASVPLLLVCYDKVKKNPGSTMLAYLVSNKEYEKLDSDQKNLINRLDKGIAGIDMEIFEETSQLLKRGKYPWGTSRRIYIDKPGKPGAKRPIIIPPIMDRVIQEAIKNVLSAIYEPYFDQMNCSFGFRPGIGVHDAIYALTNKELAQGLDKAIEGDIKSAYDKVNRKKLIEILAKKIKDKKFLNLIEKRLNYDYFDTEKDKYIKDIEGIPQGGTDSQYLWNIYMLEFDSYVMTEIKNYVALINEKTRGKNSHAKKFLNNERERFSNKRVTIQKILNHIWMKKEKFGTFKEDLIQLEGMKLAGWKTVNPIFKIGQLKSAKSVLKECNLKNRNEQEIIDFLQKKQKECITMTLKMPFQNQNKKRLRFIYVRYADDWIIISNLKKEMLLEVKGKLSNFLKEELYSELSDEKTKITDIKKEPAHFLGFEIRTYKAKKIEKRFITINNVRKRIVARTAGERVFAGVDKQRLIDILHMEGYCTNKGFPREITKLNNLEAFTIIDKTNSVLSGLVRYYANSVRNPKSELSRWVYIIRFSCLKTLALKHRTTLRDIFNKFRSKKGKETDTIEDIVTIEVNGEKYTKTWKLETMQSLMKNCRSKNEQLRKGEIMERFWKLRNNEPIQYAKKNTTILNIDNFLERINWINLRTKASFDLPCALCGSNENVEMHHIKHARKTKYTEKENTWEQVMGLRNRRQMPVCRFCHSLTEFTINKLYDNRIVNSESYIHKAASEEIDYKKTLLQKGWKLVR